MTNETKLRLQHEYDAMRARIDSARLQTNLGKMELRAKLEDIRSTLDPIYRRAKSDLTELARSGATDASNFAKSLQAGWDAQRETLRELSNKAKQ
jgi:hypothetical protein